MRFLSLLIALPAALVALGCGDDAEPRSPIPTEGTIFEYSRAGGLAFSIYEVKIEADGTGTARFGSDFRNLEEKEFALSEAELEELRTVLVATPISSFPDQGEAVCADCFEYTYAYGGDEYTRDDASEPVEGLEKLGALLSELTETANVPIHPV